VCHLGVLFHVPHRQFLSATRVGEPLRALDEGRSSVVRVTLP